MLLGHWPGFYFNGEKFGFDVLKEVKRRLDDYDPGRVKTIWMKTSQIGHYWMARQLSDIEIECENEVCRLRVTTTFPTANFTLELSGCEARRIQLNGIDLRQVHSRQGFQRDTFLVEGKRTFVAFDLSIGEATIDVIRSG